MTVMTPYRSEMAAGPDRFAQLLRAEWTKFRTVRGWMIGMLVALLLIVLLAVFTGSASQCSSADVTPQNPNPPLVACPPPPAGPGGEWVTDNFYLVRQPLDDSGSITVRATSLTGQYSANGALRQGPNPTAGMTQGVQPWSKAGIIIKAGTAPGSAYAAMMVTGSHGVRMQWDFTHDVAGLAGNVSAASPRWLRLTRSGDVISGYDSADGTHWTLVGTATLAGLPRVTQAGLFAASPDYSVTTTSLGGGSGTGGPSLATAAFDRMGRQGTWPASTWTGDAVAGARLASAVGFRETDGRFTVTGSGDIAPAVGGPDVGVGQTVERTLAGTFAGLIVVVIIGVMFITAEYRRGLIRTTFAASPRRGRVLAAKAVVLAAVTFVISLVAVVIAIPVGERLLRENGNPILPVSVLTEARIAAGTAALLAVAAVLALAVGTLLRRSAVAVAAVIAGVVLPYMLAVIAGVLPVGAGEWLVRVTPAAAFAVQQSVTAYPQVTAAYTPANGYFPLAPWAGLAVLCAWTALALALATFLLRRRDV
jgi:ABC-type transport system involved in multi-copper enzyme maturation permease subunit